MKVRIRVAFTVEVESPGQVKEAVEAIYNTYEGAEDFFDLHVVAVSRDLPNGKLEVGHSPQVKGG